MGSNRTTLATRACLLLLACAVAAFAQDAGPEFKMSELLKMPGKVVAKGSNATAAGQYKLRSYRVEEIALPHAATVDVRGRSVSVTKAYRVTLIGGPFPVRLLPPVVWIGDEAVGYGVEGEDLDEITAVTYDAQLLRDGATLYLSYGEKSNKEARTAVPEKLKLGKQD
ncbi:MAG: hypothetical protein M3268_00050 [Acidobacteriota bacterium]|nr:hypothetical protein [Acidobacteriota bacterium]